MPPVRKGRAGASVRQGGASFLHLDQARQGRCAHRLPRAWPRTAMRGRPVTPRRHRAPSASGPGLQLATRASLQYASTAAPPDGRQGRALLSKE